MGRLAYDTEQMMKTKSVKKKTKKSKITKRARGAKAPKAPAKKQDAQKTATAKRLSALDAAAQVLRKAEKPLTSKALIAAMAQQSLWKSPAGKTPHATLYAAMLREIGSKGDKARFKKVERGLFAFNG